MNTIRTIRISTLLAALSLVVACDAVDRARTRLATPDTVAGGAGSGLALGMQLPGALSPGAEGIVGLSVANRSDTAISYVRLELIVPGWVEPMPPRPGEREVSMAALDDGSTRFAYLLGEPPLQPGETQVVAQRVRVRATAPPAGEAAAGRMLRARLIGPDGQPLAEVESDVGGPGFVGSDTAAAPAPGEAVPARDRIGPVRLGMSAAELRTAVTDARDTTWTQEGMTEGGVIVPLSAGGRVVAVLAADTVQRVVVNDPAVRTREQLGVGSRLEELRSAYGRACADMAEGRVVVWFQAAPGISFALDAPPPQDVARLRTNPETLPGSARVTEWWLRTGTDECPR